MNIAVIGSGNVGTALGDGFTAKGHNVVYGSTDPKKKAGERPEVRLRRGCDREKRNRRVGHSVGRGRIRGWRPTMSRAKSLSIA